MNNELIEDIENGILTEPMDNDSRNFEDFKLLIRSKVTNASKDERIKVALLALKYKMEDYYSTNLNNIEVGNFIKSFIESTEIKQNRFAEYIDMKPSNFSKILSGDRKINMELALILEKLSDIEAELWLNIQSKNDLAKISKRMNVELKKYRLNQLIE